MLTEEGPNGGERQDLPARTVNVVGEGGNHGGLSLSRVREGV